VRPDEARIRQYVGRAQRFAEDAAKILGSHETSAERLITLDASYADLDELSVQQDDLFRQALRCVEHGLFRAAHVMAWAAFMDFLEEKLSSDGLVKLRALRPAWKGSTMEEMREYVAEHQLIEATQPLGLCTKNQMKALHGLLHRRNECAHPSSYFPGLNETLGYISETIQRLKQLQPKSL
jgi:hypothetical protein